MRYSHHHVAWLAILIATLLGSRVQSQDDAESLQAEAARQFEYFACLADKFDARLASGIPLKRSGPSILNWTIGSSWQGSFYVWTCNDRPALVGCFLADTEKPDFRRTFVEMHAMADEPFTPLAFAGVRNYEWNPEKKSTSTVPVVDFAPPAESERLRGSQMRELAGQYQVTMYEEVQRGTGKEELRLLTKPLYRYPRTAARDGAIFAFVTSRGTDPEFLLAVECDPKRTRDEWSIRPMRFCTRKLDLHRGDKAVWSIGEFAFPESVSGPGGPTTKMSDPYMIVTLMETSTKNFEAIRARTLSDAKK